MPSVQGTNDFNHAIDAGYYTDGFFGTPTQVTTPTYLAFPKTLRIITTGGNEGARHNITGTPTRGWAAFPWQSPSSVVGTAHAIHSFGTTSGATVGAIYRGSTGLHATVGGVDGAEFAVLANTWYWVETIFDVSLGTHTVYLRVNGTDAASASTASGATTITWSQLISFAGDESGLTNYYGGNWKWGSAASNTDWLGAPGQTLVTPSIFWSRGG